VHLVVSLAAHGWHPAAWQSRHELAGDQVEIRCRYRGLEIEAVAGGADDQGSTLRERLGLRRPASRFAA